MAGEEFRRLYQLGKEVTEGVAIPATRKIYGTGAMKRDRAQHTVEAQTGNRAMNVDGKIRQVIANGTLVQPLSADEMIEWLLMGVQGGITPTVQGAPTPTVQPTPTNAGTGGTILAGVQTVVYTIVTPAGESQGLTVTATTTTTGSTSTVTVPAVTPLPAGTTAVNYYLSTPGGGAVSATFAGTNAAGASITLTAPGNGTQFPPATTPTAVQTWLFKAIGTTLDSGTMEFYDGERNWQYNGTRLNTLSIAGKPDADTTVTLGFMARNGIPNAQTPALADRVLDVISGWETQLFIDAFGGTPGTTNIPATLLEWKVDFTNNMAMKYFGDNTTATGAIIIGKLGLKVDLTLEADTAALAEYTNRETAIKRLIRLQFGNNEKVGTGTGTKKIAVDVPCVCGAIDITGTAGGTSVYKFTYEYVNDPTNGWPLQVTVVNGRATAY